MSTPKLGLMTARNVSPIPEILGHVACREALGSTAPPGLTTGSGHEDILNPRGDQSGILATLETEDLGYDPSPSRSGYESRDLRSHHKSCTTIFIEPYIRGLCRS